MSDIISSIYAIQESKIYEGDYSVSLYHEKHGIESILILKNHDEKKAKDYVKRIKTDINGKIVVEIGAGVGYLSFEIAKYAKKVIAIEADPAWTWYFVEYLYKQKPINLTWIFGIAEEMAKYIKADVAIICSNSGLDAMKKVASKMAKKVIII